MILITNTTLSTSYCILLILYIQPVIVIVIIAAIDWLTLLRTSLGHNSLDLRSRGRVFKSLKYYLALLL